MNTNEELLNIAIDNSGSIICVTDLTGTVLYCNRPFLTHFSLSDDIIGKDLRHLPSDYRKFSQIQECIRDRKKLVRKKYINGGHHIKITTAPVFLNDPDKSVYVVESFTLIEDDPEKSRSDASSNFDDIVLGDEAMLEITQTISRIAYFDSTVLIQGESGTGKTVLARYIHDNSSRADKPFVTINCGSIPESLIESELFGYTSGAFTSANRKGKTGQVELANGGTLFLDEIGLLPFDLQAKFLQLIQEKTYTPVGALKSKSVDVRIISATNLDLKEQIKEKKFREDLYYRLRVIELFIPPLRERTGAVELLTGFFLEKYNSKFGTAKIITPQALSILKQYSWPGNIRELQYLIERLIITSSGDAITSDDIPPLHDSENPDSDPVNAASSGYTADFDSAVSELEKDMLLRAFRSHKSSYKVAEALGISQSKASRLLRKYSIS